MYVHDTWLNSSSEKVPKIKKKHILHHTHFPSQHVVCNNCKKCVTSSEAKEIAHHIKIIMDHINAILL